VAHIDTWGAEREAVPTMTIYPGDAARDSFVEGHVITKDSSVIVLGYETPAVHALNGLRIIADRGGLPPCA